MRIYFLVPCCITRQAETLYLYIKQRSCISQWVFIGCVLFCSTIICLNFDYILRDVGLACSPDFVVRYVQSSCQKLGYKRRADHPAILKSSSVPPLILCHQLCSSSSDLASRIKCHGPQLAKATVFTLTLNDSSSKDRPLSSHSMQVVVKSSASNSLEEIDQNYEEDHWSEASLGIHFPTKEELKSHIEEYVRQSLGISAEDTALLSLLHQVSDLYESHVLDSIQSHQDLWALIKDQEFLMSFMMEKLKLFPKVLGTCGEFYAVEHVDTLTESFLTPTLMPRNERLLKAIQLVQFVDQLDSIWHEPLHLCDVKMTHFGWTSEASVRFVDVDTVMLESALVDRLQHVPECEADDDCSFFDCAAECDVSAGQCRPARTNTNLQVVCSKIFLGVVSPGLRLQGLLQFRDESEATEDLLKEAVHLCTTNPGMTADALLRVLREVYTTQLF